MTHSYPPGSAMSPSSCASTTSNASVRSTRPLSFITSRYSAGGGGGSRCARARECTWVMGGWVWACGRARRGDKNISGGPDPRPPTPPPADRLTNQPTNRNVVHAPRPSPGAAPVSSLGGECPLSRARPSHQTPLLQGQAPMARRNTLRRRTERCSAAGGRGRGWRSAQGPSTCGPAERTQRSAAPPAAAAAAAIAPSPPRRHHAAHLRTASCRPRRASLRM